MDTEINTAASFQSENTLQISSLEYSHETSHFGGLDWFRIVAALFVIALHTSPLLSISDSADFFLTRVLARIAVPFFFMVTGQFILSDLLYQNEKYPSRLWHYIKKVLVLYGISIVLYLPIGFYAGHYENLSFLSVLRMLIFDGTFYHLWYFPACIIGILLLYLLNHLIHIKRLLLITGLLYLVGLFGDSYYGLTVQVTGLAAIYEHGFHIWSYTRNGLFFAPIFLILGAIIGKKQKCSVKLACAGLIFSFLLMTAEAFILHHFQMQRHDSMYVMLPSVMVFLYLLLLSFHSSSFHMLRTVSTWIYILHPSMIVLVRGIAKISGMSALIDNRLLHYFAVVFLSVIIAFVIAVFLECRKKKNFAVGRAWIEINRKTLRENVSFLQSRLPANCKLMPAVKADAYGHGAVFVAKELNRMGVNAFCVACVQEGMELRKAGIKGEILILGYTHPAQFDLLRRYHLTQTVVDYSYAEQLKQYGKKLHVHVGIDTGMHRLGERSDNMERIQKMFQINNFVIDGMFTHLSADETRNEQDEAFTYRQEQEFHHVVDELTAKGISCPKVHLQASYGVLNYPELSGDYARVGIALYGILSTGSDTAKWSEYLQPILSLKVRIACVKNINSGESAGYGLQFVAPQSMKIAVLAIGYADGLPRSLSNGVGAVLIHGKKAPIIGRICMDQTLVDVSDIANVQAGDIAIIIGKSGELEISACDLAEQTNTITNEILSRMGARLERLVV